jgi:muramidase (phage lysozyme)
MDSKILSSSKINPTKLLGGSSFANNTNNISEKLKEDSITISKSDLSIIKGQVFEIKNLVTNLTTLKKKRLKTERKETERERFDKREKELEKKKKPEDNKIKLPQAPKLGFLDIIRRFVVNTLIGFIAIRLIKHLPKMIEVVKFLGGAMDFITNVGGNLLNGLATFVQKGYEAYDFTRKTLKTFGGDNAVKLFDGFNNALGGIVTAALAASFALFDMAGGDSSGSDNVGIKGRTPGRSRRGIDPKLARRYTERFGRDAAARKFGQEGVRSLGGKYARSGAENLARNALVGVAGKSGAKKALKVVAPLVRNVPLIGGIMEFVLSWMSGDPIGKAAFKGVGAGLGTWIGGALGSLIPIPGVGTAIGMWIGSAGGSKLAEVIYDKIFNNKDPNQKKQKVAKAAGGGQAPVTRGGKIVSGPRRSITKSKVKRQIAIQPTQLKPGADVGGEKKIEKVFPKSKDKNQVSPLDYIEKSYKNTNQDKSFGSLLNLQTKSLVGQKPSKIDYKNAAQGLSNWMTMTFSDEILRTGAVYAAGGGEINADMLSKKSGDMTDAIARSLEDSISKRLDANIDDLMKQMMLKQDFKKDPSQEGVDQPTGEGDILYGTTSGEYGPILDLIASVEAVGGYDVVNGGKIDGLSKMTISAARQAALRSGGSGAMGRYQQMPQFVLDRARSIGLNPDRDLFSPENQDKLAILLINGAGYKEWKSKNLSTEKFAHRLSATWRGLPEGPSNKTYQDRYASRNKAHTSWANVMATLNAVQSGRISGGQFGGGILGTGRVGAVDQFTPIAKKFGLQVTSAYRPGDPGYHGKDRARDYSNDGVGRGTPQQLAFAQHLAQNYGASLKQLIYTPLGFGIANGKRVGLDYWGSSTNAIHYDHVHVAFFHGGFVPKDGLYNLHKGEFVVDKDSVDLVGKDFIATINAIENKTQLQQKVGSLIGHLSYITEYEPGGQQQVVVEMPEPEVIPMMMPVPIGGGGMMIAGSGSGYDYTQGLSVYG